MKNRRFAIAAKACNGGMVTLREMPERFRPRQNDLDDLQRDIEPVLRSVAGSGASGTCGSYRVQRWERGLF